MSPLVDRSYPDPAPTLSGLKKRPNIFNGPGLARTSFLLFEILGILFGLSCSHISPSKKYYAIRIIDSKTQKGIPMVEMKMLNALVYHTDNKGYISFCEPDLMGQELYFELKSAGYRYPMDETGRQGVSLNVWSGRDTILQMQRTNIAERLYRITGSGKNVHQHALGLLKEPEKLVAGILGQDSNLAMPYRGNIFWAWGDTFLPDRYQGNFSVAAAWTPDPRISGWSAEDGIHLNYFTDSRGWSKSMINIEGPGYVWFDFLMNIKDSLGAEKLIAKYGRVNAFFGNYERGIAVYNHEREVFEKYRNEEAWMSQFNTTEHPTLNKVENKEYYYLTSEFNFSRVSPSLDAIAHADQYEYFTCLPPGEKMDSENLKVDRNEEGELVYGWKSHSEAVGYSGQKELIESGLIAKNEALIQTVDLLTGSPIEISRGSIYWNQYRQRWILIAGSTDIWYGEADTPTGPWVYLRKVATHEQFLYNPVHYDFLDQNQGKRIYFEGTFTKFFSKEPAIPRYDYNQLMYALNLDSPDLFLPVPIYQMSTSAGLSLGLRKDVIHQAEEIRSLAFFTLDRKVDHPDVVSIGESGDGSGRLVQLNDGKGEALFYGIVSDFSPVNMFNGSFEFKIAYKSFDNSTRVEIKNEQGTWKIIPQKSTFQFSNLEISQNVLEVDLSHEGENYHLSGLLIPGGIDGSFFKGKSESPGGSWSADKMDSEWWTPLSPNLVDLYQVSHRDGTYSYSLSRPVTGNEFEVLCKVWSNPFRSLPFDFAAVAVTN